MLNLEAKVHKSVFDTKFQVLCVIASRGFSNNKLTARQIALEWPFNNVLNFVTQKMLNRSYGFPKVFFSLFLTQAGKGKL